MRGTARLLFVLLAAATLACGGRAFMVPPRIDLKQHELIGMIDFRSSSEGELGPLATRRFGDAARRDQGLVRIVGLGPLDDVLGSVGGGELSPETFRAIGREHGVKTILTGELTVSDVRPGVRIAPDWRSGSLSAQVDATLAVQLVETSSGASIWSASARATQSVGQISVFKGGHFVFDADDPERAYGGLVDSLVAQVTRDFQVTWERR